MNWPGRRVVAANPKVRIGLLAGLASGVVAAVVTVLRRRARRRSERRNAEFAKASEGLWPEVPPGSTSEARIGTERAGDDPAEPAAAGRDGTGEQDA